MADIKSKSSSLPVTTSFNILTGKASAMPVKIGTTSGLQKTSQPVVSPLTPKSQTGSAASPSFFTKSGQSTAVKRVVDVLTLNYDTLNSPVGNVAPIIKPLTVVAEAGSVLYGGSLLFGGTGAAAAAGTGGAVAALRSGFLPLTVGAVGGLLGGSLFGDKGASTAPQNMSTVTNQNTYSYQTTNTSQDTYNTQYLIGSPGANPVLYGNPSQSVTPSQRVIPTQDVTPTQSQTASSGANWALIALAVGGLYLITRK